MKTGNWIISRRSSSIICRKRNVDWHWNC